MKPQDSKAGSSSDGAAYAATNSEQTLLALSRTSWNFVFDEASIIVVVAVVVVDTLLGCLNRERILCAVLSAQAASNALRVEMSNNNRHTTTNTHKKLCTNQSR